VPGVSLGGFKFWVSVWVFEVGFWGGNQLMGAVTQHNGRIKQLMNRERWIGCWKLLRYVKPNFAPILQPRRCRRRDKCITTEREKA
jgi:hypothetical protein